MLCTKIAKLDWNARPWLAGSPRLTMCASWCKHIHSHSLVQRRWLSFLSTTAFEHVPVEDDVIGDIIVRAAILRKLEPQKLVEFVLQEIKPLMGAEEILHLHIEVDIHIEVSGT